jgi:cytochrome P450
MEIQYDPFAPEFRADPYPAYETLRRDAPVYWAERSKMWVLSRYDDVVTVLKDTERFSSDAMATVLLGYTPTRYRGPLAPGIPRPSLVTSDPPVHTELRNILNRGFTPRQISTWQPALAETVEECLATMRAQRRFDIIRQLAIPVPVMVIAQILGVEKERYADFKRWASVITVGMNGSKRHLGFVGSGAAAASGEMSDYLRGIIERHTDNSHIDVISILMNATDGEVLSTDEAIIFANLLLFAGSETTTNLIGNAIHALLDRPALLARVAANPQLVAAVIEETLRWDPPVQYLFRRTNESVEIAGQTIAAESNVALLLGSANRDETRWGGDAAIFDIDREQVAPHVAFGFGAHFCLGAALARMEAMAAIARLLPHLSRARRMSGPPEYVDSFQFHGLASIPMEWV